jgi:hypothetical protein
MKKPGRCVRPGTAARLVLAMGGSPSCVPRLPKGLSPSGGAVRDSVRDEAIGASIGGSTWRRGRHEHGIASFVRPAKPAYELASARGLCADHKIAARPDDSERAANSLLYKCLPIGAPGFEPGTPCSQSRCATGLRHAPKLLCGNALPDLLRQPLFQTVPESNVSKEYSKEPVAPPLLHQT